MNNVFLRIILITVLIGLNKVDVFSRQFPPLPDAERIDLTYLGQEPPGTTPRLFAPDIFTLDNYRLHSLPAFSPLGDEIFWAVIPPQVLHMKLEKDGWTKPKPASFSQGNIQAPVFSPDGIRVYYQMAKKDGYGSLDIWFSIQTDTGWSIPFLLNAPPNSASMESQPSLTNTGKIYFSSILEGSGWNRGIYCSCTVDSSYKPAELLPPSINSKYIDAYPFISPDESFLLFSSSRPSMEESELRLFASFRNNDGNWTEPISISDFLNITTPIRFACVSPDMKYLFYLSNGQIYWVEASIIYKARNEL